MTETSRRQGGGVVADQLVSVATLGTKAPLLQQGGETFATGPRSGVVQTAAERRIRGGVTATHTTSVVQRDRRRQAPRPSSAEEGGFPEVTVQYDPHKANAYLTVTIPLPTRIDFLDLSHWGRIQVSCQEPATA